MIAALTGQLHRVEEGHVLVQSGPILYELLVPAADMAALQTRLAEEITFHTIFYLAGDATRGGLEPTLIGFLRPEDKKFFELFTTVKGIGPKRALRPSPSASGRSPSPSKAKTPASSFSSPRSANAPPNRSSPNSPES